MMSIRTGHFFVSTRGESWAGLCFHIVVLVLLHLAIQFGSHTALAQDAAYGAYGLFPGGTTRVLAMGGAAVGLSDDAGAVLYNPAGLSMSRWIFDLAGTTNRVVNREVDFDGDTQLDGLPYDFVFSSLGLRLGPLGIGGGYSQPYNLDFSSNFVANGVTKLLKIESRDLAISWRFWESLSFGMTGHQEKVVLGYKDEAMALDLESQAEAFYLTFGFRYNNDRKIGLGVTYSPERRYNLDESLDTQITPSAEWFHDVVVPAKLVLGGSVKLTGRLMWVGDVDIYYPVKKAFYVGGSSTDPSDQVESDQKVVIHGGFEYQVINNKNIAFVWRGGGYQEPPRLNFSKNRLHYTMGVEVRLGFITLSAAYDQAPDFSNIAQTLGLSLSALN